MDRGGARHRFLRLGAALALCQAAIAATPSPELRAARWLAPGTRARALSERPAECYVPPAAQGARASAEIGRAAFRTPLLLGGQAARAGLSCESCHRAGRGNPDFQFQGLSGDPGTADVTSSLMSSHRGNQRFDPVPIPDLAMPGRISRASGDPMLRSFIRGLVVEEFDGAEPPPRVLDGLAAYVRALDAGACGQGRMVTLADQLDELDRARAAALDALRQDDRPTARLMIAAMRTALGQIDERYAGRALERHRRALRAADRDLLAIRQALDRGDVAASARLDQWARRAEDWTAPLRRDEPRSLYNAAMLRRLYAAPVASAR